MSELKKNQNLAHKQTHKAIDKLDKEILKIYRGSLKSIRSELMKLSEKKQWSLNEMSKYDRLQKFEKQVIAEMRKISAETLKLTTKTNTAITNNTYNRNWFGYTKELGMALAFGKINPELVKGIVTEPYPGVKLSDLIKDVGTSGVKRIKFEIGTGLVQGESAAKISRRIKEALNISYNKAIRITRTEGGRASTKAALVATETANKKGIETTKVWMSTLDMRTRDRHRGMDGRKADKNGEFFTSGGTSMGQGPELTGRAEDDINCRCTYYDQIVGLDDQVEKRRENVVKSGKKEIIDNMNYNKWMKLRS